MKEATRPRPDRSARAGRPRDPRLDEAITRATTELVAERGYNGLSITAVAERAGTTAPAIYRRWSSKAELVVEAVFRTGGPDVVADTGDLEADVRTMVRWTLEKLGSPVGRAALAGLLGEPAGAQGGIGRQLARVWQQLGDRLRRAAEAGESRSDLDLHAQICALCGPAMLATVIRGDVHADDETVDSLTSIALGAIDVGGERGELRRDRHRNRKDQEAAR